jgi:hypothetical protein
MARKKAIEYKKYELKAYWDSRLQTAQECAVELVDFLHGLEQLGFPFTNWDYLNSKDKREHVQIEPEFVRKQLLLPGNGARRGVKPEATIPAMGFWVLLFSQGKVPEGVTLTMTYGASQLRGRCGLQLPHKGDVSTQTLQVERLQQVLEVVVKTWNPEWAVIDYLDLDNSNWQELSIPVYWFVYISQQRGQIPPLPAPAQVKQIEGYGSYAIVTPEPFTRDREDHREIADRVKNILDEAGLLVDRPE